MKNSATFVMGKQLFVYAIGGGMAALVNWSLTYLFTEVFVVWYLLSAAIGNTIGILVNFLYQRRITFNKKDRVMKRLSRFVLLMFATWLVYLALVYVFTEFATLFYMLSVIISTFLVAILNFIGNKFWTFRDFSDERGKNIAKTKVK